MDRVRVLQLQALLDKQLADDQITDEEYRKFLRHARIASDEERLLQMITTNRARRALVQNIRWEKQALEKVKPRLIAREQLGAFGWFKPWSGELGLGGMIDPAHVTHGALVSSSVPNSEHYAETMMNWMSPGQIESTAFHEGLHGVWQFQMEDKEKDVFRQSAAAGISYDDGGIFGRERIGVRGDVAVLAMKAPAYANMVVGAARGNEQYLDLVANELWAHKGTARVYDTDDMYKMGKDRVQSAVMDKYIMNDRVRRDITATYTGWDAAGIGKEHLAGLNANKVISNLREADNEQIPFSYSVNSPVVHGQRISDEIVEFRDKYFSSPEGRAELKKRKDAIPLQYGDIDPSRLTDIGDGKAEVDISGWDAEWEDVDTLLLKRGMFEEDIAIRLTGIDSPEVGHPGDPTEWLRFRQEQPFGVESTRRVNEEVGTEGLRVVIDSDPDARTYNRYLGLIYKGEEEKALNLQFVERGLAASLPFGDAGSDMLPREEFMAAEHEAIRARQGMWNLPFYQKYLAMSAGVGGRLTFNTFTDLSRMGKNYHLAAAHEALWDDSASRRDAYVIGEKLVPSYGKFFGKKAKQSEEDLTALNYMTAAGRGHERNQGLRHGGIAQSMRREMTAFGSGYDVARAVAKLRGMSFKQFLHGQEFQSALASSKQVRTLGEGTFGQTFLHKTTLNDEPFFFVEKRLFPDVQERAAAKARLHAEHSVGQEKWSWWRKKKKVEDRTAEILEAWKGSTTIEAETGALRALGDTPAIPSLYAGSEKQQSFFMEYMPGSTIDTGLSPITGEAFSDLQSSAKTAAERGFLNMDIHGGNFMYDAGSDRAAWLDWGMARRVKKGSQKGEELMRYGIMGTVPVEGGELRAMTLAAQKHFPSRAVPATNYPITAIEGLHPGAGPKSRWTKNPDGSGGFDDFGSTWKGIFGGIDNFMATSADEFTQGMASYIKNTGVKTVGGGKLASGAVQLGVTQAAHVASRRAGVDFFAKRGIGQHARLPAQINWNPAGNAKQTGFRDSIKELSKFEPSLGALLKDPAKMKAFEDNVFAHELSEVFHKRSGLTSFSRPTKTNPAARKKFGTHQSPGVIVDEALYALKTGGEEQFRTMWAMRRAVRKWKPTQPGMTADNPLYSDRVEKIYATMEKNWLPKFNQPKVAVSPSITSVPRPSSAEPMESFPDYATLAGLGSGVGVMGLGVIALTSNEPVNHVPGKDDAYNTIEGLHPGAGPKSRWTKNPDGSGGFDDFGSAWRGLVHRLKRTTSGLMEKIRPRSWGVNQIGDIATLAKTQDASTFFRTVGVASENSSKRAAEMIPALAEGLGVSAEAGFTTFTSRLAPRGLPARALSKVVAPKGAFVSESNSRKYAADLRKHTGASITDDDFMKQVAFHESAEYKGLRMLENRPSLLRENPRASHHMAVVMEEKFLREYGNEDLYRFVKAARHQSDPWFSGFDDAYNSIEGLRHEGLAPELRKLMTEFGSGWTGLFGAAVGAGVAARGVATGLGQIIGGVASGVAHAGIGVGIAGGKVLGRVNKYYSARTMFNAAGQKVKEGVAGGARTAFREADRGIDVAAYYTGTRGLGGTVTKVGSDLAADVTQFGQGIKNVSGRAGQAVGRGGVKLGEEIVNVPGAVREMAPYLGEAAGKAAVGTASTLAIAGGALALAGAGVKAVHDQSAGDGSFHMAKVQQAAWLRATQEQVWNAAISGGQGHLSRQSGRAMQQSMYGG